MIMNKREFVELLNYLTTNGIIEDFEFIETSNSICVWLLGGEERIIYDFDENEKSINPIKLLTK